MSVHRGTFAILCTGVVLAAQAMAVSAPLSEYPYQAKRANITGSGVCVMTIDAGSGKVMQSWLKHR